jgi:uncharacterized membrane protein YhfC
MISLLINSLGMLAVGIGSVVIWRSISGVGIRSFALGALLWAVAVPPKLAVFWLTSAHVIGCFRVYLPYPFFIAAAGAFVGCVGSVFEVGIIWIAARIWPALGRDAGRAIAIGLGAGAFEALLLGLVPLLGALAIAVSLEDAEEIRDALQPATTTPLFCLLGPAERLIALVVHTASRTLVLLGVAKGKPLLTCSGFVLFAAIEGSGGALLVSGVAGRHNPSWWNELAILPIALISLPILWWCYRRWRNKGEVALLPVCPP